MTAQTPMVETTTSPTPESAPSAPPVPVLLHPSADEVVSRFLSDLRRRDLDALALLLRDDPAVGAPVPDEVCRDEAARAQGARDQAARDQAARDQAARDCAQVVLRSFSGSGLVESERHASTDGQTVFVEFRRDHPDAGWTERRTGIRLLRFTTRGGSITGITEYAHPFAAAVLRGDTSTARPGSDRTSAGRGGRVSDSLAWPSLNAIRPADPRTAGR